MTKCPSCLNVISDEASACPSCGCRAKWTPPYAYDARAAWEGVMIKTLSSLAQVTLRPVVPDDQSFLLQLYATTRLDELRLLDWDENQRQAFIGMQFNAQRQHYNACYPHADARIVLLDGHLVGRILVDRGERETTLVDIALLPEHRGLGIGTRLIQELLEEAALAANPVRLHVLKSNPALRLYERLGFSGIGDNGVYIEMVWLPQSQ